MPIIIGIDPGFDRMGYGLVSSDGLHETLLSYGCVTTPKSESLDERLLVLSEKLDAVLLEGKPECAGVEKLYFSSNAKTAMDVGQARGVILLALKKRGIRIIELTPLQVKQAVCGWGKADKRQVQSMVKTLLKIDHIPKPDDAADALAIALCASRHDAIAMRMI